MVHAAACDPLPPCEKHAALTFVTSTTQPPNSQVVAGTNLKVQAVVTAARASAATGTPYDATAAMVQVAAISAVVQQDLAAGISELATRVAADPSLDLVQESAALETVRGCCWERQGVGGGLACWCWGLDCCCWGLACCMHSAHCSRA